MARKGENIYKRKDGRWEGRYKVGYDASGKPKYRSIYGRTYQAVKEKLTALKAEPTQFKSSGKMTIGELYAEWLSAVKIRAKTSTIANYRMKADRHILPVFGTLQYDALTVKRVNDFITEKLASGLSAKYVSDIVVMLKSIAKYAAKVHNFRNLIADAQLPKIQKKELFLLNEKQRKILCRYIDSHLNNTTVCILLCLYTGLRIGEICGLKWADIDLGKRFLIVKRTVQRISENHRTRIIVGTPKSGNSQRIIPIPMFLIKLLKGIMSDSDDYVLSGSDKIVEPRTMQNRFKAVMKKALLPSINFHSHRHMFATNCLQLGFDVKTLSELLGHSSVETTLNRYVHSSMERKTACMDMLTFAA